MRGTRGGRRIQAKTEKSVRDRIFNLSKKVLTDAEKKILGKGRKFALPSKLNTFPTYMDVHKYVHKLNIKRYIMSNPIKENRIIPTDVQYSILWNA